MVIQYVYALVEECGKWGNFDKKHKGYEQSNNGLNETLRRGNQKKVLRDQLQGRENYGENQKKRQSNQ